MYESTLIALDEIEVDIIRIIVNAIMKTEYAIVINLLCFIFSVAFFIRTIEPPINAMKKIAPI